VPARATRARSTARAAIRRQQGRRADFPARWRGARPAASRKRLAPDHVVNLEDLRFPGLDPYLRQDGHEALGECVELLARFPDLAHADVPVHDEAHVELHPVRREVPHLLKTPDGIVVLLRGTRRRVSEAGQNAHGDPLTGLGSCRP